ncbi:MAG: tetratricopeptide repeat protein [Saprospiraceae bacterium]|nr:tetratricopeptide repeat protein [Saprospiraceae bacterium]
MKALDYFKGNYKNPRLLVLLQNGLAVAYANDNKNDQALEMLNKSAVVFEKNDFQGKEFNLGFFYNQLGRIYAALDYTKAEKYINKALTVAENLSIVDLKISAYYYMGEILFHQKKWDAAESYYIKRLALEKNKSYLIKSDAIQDLLLFYQKTQNKDKILQLIPQYISIQDSATQQIIENKYAEFEVAFKVKEKELQNDILTKEKDYQKNKATILQILGSALLLLLGLVVGLWYRLKNIPQN